MKRIFGFGSKKGVSPLGSASVGQKNNRIDNFLMGYHVRDRDLGKIHKAACVGNVAKVQQILFLGKNGVDDRDKMNRTALHLACANGHPEVVTLLIERKCHLNLCDNENRTALMKAVQCQEEKCVNILLENGADPNIRDVSGNTALHYAAFGDNISIIEKLLLYNANTEAINKDNFTPLLVAVNENKQQIVEFLIEKAANIHAVDKLKSNYEIICRHKEEIMLKNSLQNSSPVEDKNSEEDSLTRLSDKPGIDDSWPTSDSEDLDFGTKNVPKPSVAKLLHSSGQFMKNMRAKRGSVKAEGGTLSEDNNPDSENEDVGETLSKPPTRDYGDSLPIFPSAKSLLKPSLKTSAVLGLPKEGTAKSAMEAKEDGIGIIENVPPEQTVNDSLTSGGVHKNYRSDMMSALGLGEEEDVESPSDPESMSESPNKYVPHLSGAADQKGQSILNGQVEDVFYIPSCMSGSRNFKMAKLEDTRNVGIPVTHMDPPEKYPHLKPTVEVEDSFSDKTVGMKDIQTSRSDFSEWESTSLTFGNETCQTSKNLKVDDKCTFVSQPMIKNQSASTDSGPITLIDKEKINIGTVLLLGNCTLHDLRESQLPENRESKEADLDLELTSVEERERLDGSENNHPQYQVPLKVEEKKPRSSDMEVSENIHDAVAAGLIQQRKNGKTDNHQFPITENKDSDSSEPGLHKKLKKGEDEEGTSEESVITPVLKKADSLTGGLLQMNESSSLSEKDQHESRPAKKISKKKNKVKKQVTSMDDLVDLIQSSETASEDCELPYSKNFMLLVEQLGMDCKDTVGFLKIQDIVLSYERLMKLNKSHCKLLTGKIKKMEKTVSALQNELREAKDMKSRLEHQKVEWEHEFCSLRFTLKQEEEKRRNADMLYEKIRERLRRKEDQYNKEVETKQQFELALRTLNMELKAAKNHLNQVVMRQLQQELADTLKKQSMSEASLEVTSRYRLSLEDETRDLKKKLGQVRSQLQEAQDRHAEAVRYAEKTKDHMQKLEVKNTRQEETIKQQAAQIQDLQSNLLRTSLLQEAQDQHAEAVRYAEKTLEVKNTRQEETIKQQAAQIQDLQSNLLRTSLADDLTTKLETTSSKCLHLDAKNQVLQQELLSMKALGKKCEKLESNSKKLQQEVVKLKSFMEMNMVERSQVEQYKREIEERARLEIVEKLKEVNLFLQAQAAAQENLDQLRENAHASMRSQMELRIKDLESQVSTMKTSQEDSTKTELETYRQLYLEELKARKSLRNKLNRTNERLSEINTKLLVERQQHQTLLSTLTMRSGLEPPYCGHFENNLVLNRNLTPRGNLVIPTSNPRPSYDYRETSLWKMQWELEKSITKALEEAATEFESGSCRTPLVSTDDSILNQDLVWKASQEYVQILNKNYMI
ncbi:ankyrin repeat domain-containing protein 26 isoform X10 [Panthera pardus]|uniref:Ankyrin repeat domain-containing protein 26 isoform X10 n=1 Tax=Panthera pardus TaxID=9691 RepID=A0A9V1GEI0_PANPR|nr:ankyrin repeat domain-containing protein 26 isoform X10 [Panthera pardus]